MARRETAGSSRNIFAVTKIWRFGRGFLQYAYQLAGSSPLGFTFYLFIFLRKSECFRYNLYAPSFV